MPGSRMISCSLGKVMSTNFAMVFMDEYVTATIYAMAEVRLTQIRHSERSFPRTITSFAYLKYVTPHLIELDDD